MDAALAISALGAAANAEPAPDGRPWRDPRDAWQVVWSADTESTQDDAAACARSCGQLGARWLLVGSDHQRAGRGRQRSQWHGTQRALLVTLGCELDAPLQRWPVASLIVGVTLADAIAAATGADVRWKWPNDVLAMRDGRWCKVAGCLAERHERPGYAAVWLLGFGVNIDRVGLPTRVDATSCGLDDLAPHRPIEQWLGDIVHAVRSSIERWRNGGYVLDVAHAERRLAFIGDVIACDLGTEGVQRGRFLGLAGDGRLRIAADGGAERTWLPARIVGAASTPPWQAAAPQTHTDAPDDAAP